MNTRGLFSTWVLALAVAFVGCGSGQGYNPNNVTVTVSPATATLSTNSKIGLQAAVNGLCSGCTPFFIWSITEDYVPADLIVCDWFTNNGPPSKPCPAGTIEETTSNSLNVTYHAPATQGTYHVVAETTTLPGILSKSVTSVITVTP